VTFEKVSDLKIAEVPAEIVANNLSEKVLPE